MNQNNKRITMAGLVVLLAWLLVSHQAQVQVALASAANAWASVPVLCIGDCDRNTTFDSPAIRVPAAQTAPPTGWRAAWALDLLSRLGNRQPTQATVNLVVAWTLAEDGREGPGTAWARNNPLNTTQAGFGEIEVINDDGVKGFPDYKSGMAATLQTLSYGYYAEIVAGLQTNDPERALRGLYASPWGTDATDVESLWRGM